MSRSVEKKQVFLYSFRTDFDLARLLEKEANKTDIIVMALKEFYKNRDNAIQCPRCQGNGFILVSDRKPLVKLRKERK